MEIHPDILVAGERLGLLFERISAYWAAGGWLLLPIAGITFLIWDRYFAIRRSLRAAATPPAKWLAEPGEGIEHKLRDPNVDRRLADLPGASARIARVLIQDVRRGPSFHEGYCKMRDTVLEPYEASLRVLAALVVAAPLLGLLGTVLGMVDTFDAVAARSSETTAMVAGGISRALITTQAGLLAALPGTFGLAHLARLLRRLRGDLDAFEFQLDRIRERAMARPDRTRRVAS